MADRTIKVLTPATSIDLLTLEEAKLLLGIGTGDTSQDDQLELLITMTSATIAELCNRIFARERVEETWREVGNGRLFLSHWPVKTDDIESVMSAGDAWLTNAYELEEASGKLSNVKVNAAQSSDWPQSVIVTYTGGFNLPDEAPYPLKQACSILIRDQRTEAQSAAVAGIKQIAHKEARITYFDTSSSSGSSKKSSSSGAATQLENLLKHYMRFEV
jgi:Phage gp6-like head-tail connector protein